MSAGALKFANASDFFSVIYSGARISENLPAMSRL